MLFFKKCLLKFHKVTFNFMLWQIKKEITASKINYAKTDRVMRKLYFLITLSVQIEDEKKAYLAIDLLKLSFGEKYLRQEEPLHLFSLCNELLRKKETVILSYLLDAYKPLVRNINTAQIIEIINNLNTLANLLSKDKQKNYFVSKIITLIINNLEYFCKEDNLQIALTILVKNIGIIAIKENDMALYCEINVCLTKLINYLVDSELSYELAELWSVWFYYITKKNNIEILNSYQNMLKEFINDNSFYAETSYRMLSKIKSSMIFINYNISDEIVKEAFIIYSYLVMHSIQFSVIDTIDETIRLAKLTIEKYGLEQAYAVVLLFNLIINLIGEKNSDIDKILLKVILFLEFVKVSQNIAENEEAIDRIISMAIKYYPENNYVEIRKSLLNKWLEIKII